MEATWDHGRSDHFDIDLKPMGISYLKFDLSGVTAPVQRATLTMWSTNSSNDGGTFYRVANPSWVEGNRTGIDSSSVGGPGLKWTDVDTNHDDTVDAFDSSPFVPTFANPLAALGAVPARKFVTVDLTAAFQNGPGLYSLAIRNTSTDGATFASAQWPTVTQRPVLHLELASPASFVFFSRQSLTSTPRVACPQAMVEADLPVSAVRPAENFGASDQLGACALPEKRTFLRLLVTGVGERRVDSVLLGLTADAVSGADSDSAGRLWWIADCDWDELLATWDTQPDTTDAVLLDAKGAIAAGEPVTFDVTAAISGDGVYCFVLESMSEDEVIYRASEASEGGPEVQIIVDGGCAEAP